MSSHEAAGGGDDGGDEAKLLRTFPAEIWQIVLNHVKEAQSYHNISNASPRFRTRLLPRAPEILFPSVAPLILRAHQDLLVNPSDPEILFPSEAPPYLLAHQDLRGSLRNPEISIKLQLKIRGVCPSWREGVDQVLQTQHFNPEFPVMSTQFKDLFEVCLDSHFERFHKVEDFSRFETHFQSTHANSNPFLCRAVVFSIMPADEERVPVDQYYQAGVDLMRKYGHHVWYCVINVNPEELPNLEQDQREFYLRLQDILGLMPNLRALEIQVMFPDERIALQESVYSFPTLDHLRYLELFGVPPAIVHGIVDKNPQITQVEASRERLEAHAMKAYLERLPNLRELALIVEDEPLFQTFATCQVKNCQVEKLSLEFGRSFGNRIPWSMIFRVLEHHFSENLTQLSLSLPGSQIVDIRRHGEQTQLMLPKLKALNLKMVENVSLDFLLPMAGTLEQLSVEMTAYQLNFDLQFLNKQTLNVLTFWNEPQKCNVWTLFPKLKLVKKAYKTARETLWTTCTRAEWKAAAAQDTAQDKGILLGKGRVYCLLGALQ